MLGSGMGSDALPRLTGSDALEASPAIFPSPALDRLTRAHPATPAVLFLPAVAILAFLALRGLGALNTLLAAAGGYLFWTLCEYWGHRTIFHFEPDHGLGKRLHWMIQSQSIDELHL